MIGGIAAFYRSQDAARTGRAGSALVGGFCSASLVFAFSPYGRGFWQFVLESRVELRKVFWPTRQETLHDHAGGVRSSWCIAGIFFWLLDLLLAWATQASSRARGA